MKNNTKKDSKALWPTKLGYPVQFTKYEPLDRDSSDVLTPDIIRKAFKKLRKLRYDR